MRPLSHRHSLTQFLFEHGSQHGRRFHMTRLRQFPRHDVDAARAAADDRQRNRGGCGRSHGFAFAIEPLVEDLCSGWRTRERTVGVKAEEEIGLAIVRGRGTLVDADRAVVVASQDDANTESTFDEPAEPARNVERQLFLLESGRTAHASLVAAVTGVNRQRLQCLTRLQSRKPRRLRRRKPRIGRPVSSDRAWRAVAPQRELR